MRPPISSNATIQEEDDEEEDEDEEDEEEEEEEEEEEAPAGAVQIDGAIGAKKGALRLDEDIGAPAKRKGAAAKEAPASKRWALSEAAGMPSIAPSYRHVSLPESNSIRHNLFPGFAPGFTTIEGWSPIDIARAAVEHLGGMF